MAVSPLIRPARPSDGEAIIDLLHTHMNASWTRQRWARVLTTRWTGAGQPVDIGQVLVDADKLVGFIGCVTADRSIHGRAVRTVSISSLYLLKPYRGSGLGKAMMLAGTADPEVTYIVIGASPNSEKLMPASGFSVLDRERYVWRAGRPPKPAAISIHDARAIRDRWPVEQRRLLDDHQGLDIRGIGIEAASALSLALFSVRAAGRGIKCWNALHVSDPGHFAQHAQLVADCLLQGDAVLACDRRFLRDDIDAEVEVLQAPHYFKSRILAPEMIDHLYSETVLLDLKLT